MKVLFFAEDVLKPENSKSNIRYRFSLEKEQESLTIDFAYQPKLLEDRKRSRRLIELGIRKYGGRQRDQLLLQWESFLPIGNLITVSLEDEEKFRGCAHRQSPQQHLFLSAREASPGFIPGRISTGLWTVTLNVHAIVTEECRFTLRIMGGETNE